MRILDKKDVAYESIDCITDTTPREKFGNKTPADYVIENFSREMPVVLVEDDDDSWWFSGVRPNEIDRLIEQYHN